MPTAVWRMFGTPLRYSLSSFFDQTPAILLCLFLINRRESKGVKIERSLIFVGWWDEIPDRDLLIPNSEQLYDNQDVYVVKLPLPTWKKMETKMGRKEEFCFLLLTVLSVKRAVNDA